MNPLSSFAGSIGRRFRANNEARMQRALLVGDSDDYAKALALDSLQRTTDVTDKRQTEQTGEASQTFAA